MNNCPTPEQGFSVSPAASPDLLPRGSAVAGEAGANSGQSGQSTPQGKAEGNCPAASGFGVDCIASPAARTQEHGKGLRDLFTFTLTEDQRDHLSFAALCEAESLAEGDEAHQPEVQEAIRCLWEARRILEGEPAQGGLS